MKRAIPHFKMRAIALMAISGGVAFPAAALAQDSTAPAAPTLVAAADPEPAPAAETSDVETVVVKAKVNREVNILPNEPVDSVFGFDKSIKDTPRSLTSVSNEMLTKFNIDGLNDMVALIPGSFTQSFFGVAGSLDIRGTMGENYFRGVRRVDNPGNYPTPIGASDRIDVVRGPASPIFGPSKIGGFLNFVPKSGRAQDGAYMKAASGEAGVVRGSWDKDVLHAEVGGPGKILGKDFGYYLYAEGEDSGSFYENSGTAQSVYQASIDLQATDKDRVEFGGMYHEFAGNQVAGWNRVSQKLIDHGTYVTGTPTSLDTDGDGKISAAEASAGDISSYISADPRTLTAAEWESYATDNMKLENVGTAKLQRSQVLVAPDDELTDKVTTLYFDVTHSFFDTLSLKNKMFYESMKNNNENAYGFSQEADTWAFEDQLILSYSHSIGDEIKAAYQLSPSLRKQDFRHGSNYDYEYFDRRDLTQAASALDIRTLSTRDGPTIEPYSSYYVGNYVDSGLALMSDYSFFDDVHVLGGGRYDHISIDSTCLEDISSGCDDGDKHSTDESAVSWSISLSYDIPVIGVTPYFTRAKQSTMVVGQGGDIASELVASRDAVADSFLTEAGLKGSLLDDRLYFSADWYQQQRVDYNAQDTTTNDTTKTRGWEAEIRAVVTNNLALSATYTNIKVWNLTAMKDNYQYGRFGAGDMPDDVDPSLFYGGVVAGNTAYLNKDGRKAGVPENVFSLYLIYSFDNTVLDGLTATAGITHVDSVWSGYTETVRLPAYTLLNAGLNYEKKHWKVGLQGKNLTNEEYFRSNFPNLFGSSSVLPEVPRNWTASVTYKF
ncbi:MAG: TonB-dependent receptor plug domain-containing protein [Solimonas sp.]